MQAWQLKRYGEPVDVLEQVEVPEPALTPGNVLVRVKAVALSLPDALMCRGTYAYKPPLPIIPGQEFTGEVVAVADDVVDLKAGERVAGVSAFYAGDGCFAPLCPALGASVYPIGDELSDEQAAGFVIAFHTAYTALLMRAGMTAGDTLLVSGAAGGTGSAAVQLGKALGARVIALASSDAKRALCTTLGADAVIDPAAPDWQQQVLQASEGRGVDIVFDPVGGEFYEQCFDVVCHEGRVIPIGFASGSWGDTPTWTVVSKNLSVVGALPAGFARERMLSSHRHLLELLKQQRITCTIDHTVDFAQLPTALQHVAQRRSHGRVIARIDS